MFRTAKLKIKEIYESSNTESVRNLNIRIASLTNAEKDVEGSKLVVAVEPHFLYLVVSGLHGDEANDNGDHFPWIELLKRKADGKYMYETWIGCPVLENHNPKNVRGQIVDCWPIRNEKSIDMLLRIDERINPNMVKGIRKGDITGTSMGVMVGHSYCSICKNLAYDESGWCNHLAPNKLNIKGKKYTGQDGRLYPDRIGQICEELNHDLAGVEDSIISYGEPADPKALIRQVLAVKNEDKGNTMPVDNDKAAINTRRAELLTEGAGNGIKATARYAGATEGGQTAVVSSGMSADAQLALAVKQMLNKGHLAKAENKPEYNSSIEVVKAIREGKLKKTDAITYAQEFKLVSADKIDDLSPSQALVLLEKDCEEEGVFNEIVAKHVSADEKLKLSNPGDTYNKKSEGDVSQGAFPSPQGTANPKTQLSGDVPNGGQASTVNDAKPEDGNGKPDGSVNPKSMMTHNVTTYKTDAKPEDGFPNPTKSGDKIKKFADINNQMGHPAPNGGEASDVNSAKPEDSFPNPQGKADPKSQLTGNAPNGGEASDVNSAKPEEFPKSPKGASKEVKADDVSPMGLAKMSPVEELSKAIDLVADIKEIMDDLEGKLNKKEKKPKMPGMPSEKKEDGPKAEGPKDDKPAAPKPDGDNDTDDKPKGMPAMPAIMGYKVELISDKKSPVDSYYVASLNDKPLFSISARQVAAKDKKEAADDLTVAEFQTPDYAKLLIEELNRKGALDVYTVALESKGLILSQLQDKNTPPANPANSLPNDKFDDFAKNMNATPQVTNEIANDDTQKQSHGDLILAVAADVIASSKGSSPDEFVDQMKSIFTDETKTNEFRGRLLEKVNQKKQDIDSTNSPANTPEPAPAPEMNTMKEQNQKLSALITKILPKVDALVKENKELKEYKTNIENLQKLKARASATLSIAEKKASFGLIDAKDTKDEAIRLAKLSEAELNKEVEILEKSVKIANKIKENADYTKVEGNTRTATKEVLASIPSIPSQTEDENIEEAPKFVWSRCKQQ